MALYFFYFNKKKRTCSSLTEGGAYPQHPTHPKILYTFQTHIAVFKLLKYGHPECPREEKSKFEPEEISSV